MQCNFSIAMRYMFMAHVNMTGIGSYYYIAKIESFLGHRINTSNVRFHDIAIMMPISNVTLISKFIDVDKN